MILKNGKRIDGCTDTLPVGTVQPFLGLTPPLGYLVCQGQLISKVEYPELYKICGSTFGTETDTHFYLPDLRGRTIAGYNSNDTSMNAIGKLMGVKNHKHASPLTWYWDTDGVKHVGTTNAFGTVNQKDTGVITDFYGSICDYAARLNTENINQLLSYNTTVETNFQPTMVMNWIVKAAMLIPEYFKVDNTLTSTSTSNALSAAQGKILNDKINSLSTVASTGSYNDLINKPERVDYTSQITCDYGTLNANFNYCFLKDDVVYLNLTYTLNTSLTAGTQYNFCKIPAAIRPKGNVIMYAFSHQTSHMITNYVRSSGELVIAPEKDIPAGKEINMWTVYYIK